MRAGLAILSVLVVLLVTGGIFKLSYGYFQSEELSKAEGRLSLYRATVSAELERFSHLPHILARDPYVLETALGGNRQALNLRLRDFTDQAGLDAIYLMRADGVTISASNAGQAQSFVGQNYSFRPYFRTAMTGQQGRFYGIGATTGLPGFFIADPVRSPTGDILGVIAIKIDLSRLQDSWRAAGEQVLLANGDGVVLLSSDPAWLYHLLRPLTEPQRQVIAASRQFPGQALDVLDWSAGPGQMARIAGEERLHLTSGNLPFGWELHYFASDDRALALSWLVTVAFVLLAGLALLFYQVQRTRRMGAALLRSEEEEATLRSANERLAIEIEERRTAERRLKRTQGELERASRLAALGQLSASVTHELGQPIAAMRNHLAAAEISGKPPVGLTAKIGALVERMEGITRQLKFFSRTEGEDFADVDLARAMQASMALVAPNITRAEAQLHLDEGTAAAIVRGNRLRIEQVMTNLLRNALDAVEDCPIRQINVRIGNGPEGAWFEVSDTGHGLGEATLSDLQEPFVSTRESGRGMGLGLAISAGIIKDHGGQMTASNQPSGGAVFRVVFPLAPADESDHT